MCSEAHTHIERQASAHTHSHVHTCTGGLARLLAHTCTLEDPAEAWRGVGDMERSLHSLQWRASDLQLLGKLSALQVGKYLAMSIVVTRELKELAPKKSSGRKWRLSGE